MPWGASNSAKSKKRLKFLKAGIIVVALSVFRFGYSQTGADIQIVAAAYGAGSAQIDVTAKVRHLVEAGQAVQASNELAGADPAGGKVKTLTIVYVENGQRKVATATEGETLVYDKEPTTMTDSADTGNHKSAVSLEQTKQADPQQVYRIQAQGIQATCAVLQGVERGSIVKVFAPKEMLRQVRQPGYYDPLGNMGRGEQRYYNQTVKQIKLVLITERAFVAGLRDKAEGETWEGIIYPAGTYEYTDVSGAPHRIQQFATTPELAADLLD